MPDAAIHYRAAVSDAIALPAITFVFPGYLVLIVVKSTLRRGMLSHTEVRVRSRKESTLTEGQNLTGGTPGPAASSASVIALTNDRCSRDVRS